MVIHQGTLRRCAGGAALAATLVATASLASAQTNKEAVAHVLRRMSFGPTPGQADALSQTFPADILAFIETQLDANVPEDPAFIGALTQFGVPASSCAPPNFGNWDIDDLKAQQLFYMAFSNNQLREVMTQFWQKTFSTFYPKVRNYFAANPSLTSGIPAGVSDPAGAAAAYCEFLQTEAFRNNALGSFEDLMLASAKSPNMLIYLDSVGNDFPMGSPGKPNENYAREVLELHNLGVGCKGFPFYYNFNDIQQGAFVWTGWKIQQNTASPCNNVVDWSFFFDAANHTDATGLGLPLLQTTIPVFGQFNYSAYTGAAQGEELLKYLANSYETRIHICTRLIEYLVGFDILDPLDPDIAACNLNYPTATIGMGNYEQNLIQLLGQCLLAWEQPDSMGNPVNGNIREVVRTILRSVPMNDPATYFSQIKNHNQYVIGLMRGFNVALPNYAGVNQWSTAIGLLEDNMGQESFHVGPPDGYTIESLEQISTNSDVHRFNFGLRIHRDHVFPDPTGAWNGYDPNEFNWYPLRFFLPTLLSSNDIWTNYWAYIGYLSAYPLAGYPDLGNEQEVVDIILDGLFQGDVEAASNAAYVSFLQNITEFDAAFAGMTMTQIMQASNPSLPGFVNAQVEMGNRLTALMSLAGCSPQSHLR